jgi:hypothetical protein
MRRNKRIGFYIMKAYHLTTSGRKLGLKKIIKEEPDCTIICATRHYSYNKSTECFIIGSRSEYGVQPGDKSTYIIDTGNGHKGDGYDELTINHIIHVENGQVTNDVNISDIPNAYTWVMK